MKSNNILIILVAFALVFMATSCAEPQPIDPCIQTEETHGFIFGLIHGFLAPLTFLISLISDSVAMYAVNNSGGWYDFGFLLGIGGFSGGIFKGSKKKR